MITPNSHMLLKAAFTGAEFDAAHIRRTLEDAAAQARLDAQVRATSARNAQRVKSRGVVENAFNRFENKVQGVAQTAKSNRDSDYQDMKSWTLDKAPKLQPLFGMGENLFNRVENKVQGAVGHAAAIPYNKVKSLAMAKVPKLQPLYAGAKSTYDNVAQAENNIRSSAHPYRDAGNALLDQLGNGMVPYSGSRGNIGKRWSDMWHNSGQFYRNAVDMAPVGIGDPAIAGKFIGMGAGLAPRALADTWGGVKKWTPKVVGTTMDWAKSVLPEREGSGNKAPTPYTPLSNHPDIYKRN